LPPGDDPERYWVCHGDARPVLQIVRGGHDRGAGASASWWRPGRSISAMARRLGDWLHQALRENPFAGDLFVFGAKRAGRIMILARDGTGLCPFSCVRQALQFGHGAG
jgi:hypothetical protein